MLAHVLGLSLLFLGCVAGLLALPLGLPGMPLIAVSALLYAWATDFSTIAWSTIGWLCGLTVIGEGLELLAGGVGAAGTRPSRRVTAGALGGALLGGLLGAPLLFGLGALLGALAGAFAGAALAVRSEGGSMNEALATGAAAMRGRLLGFLIKSTLAVVMVVIIVAAVW